MADGVEKRRFARTDINAAVQYRVAGDEAARDGWLGNISAGGILLWAEDELPMGATLYLRLSAEELGDTDMEVTAIIVRLDSRRQNERFGYGCRFDAIYSSPHGTTD